MDLPSEFEVVDDQGDVHGRGTVVDGHVTFVYGEHVPGGPHTHHVPVAGWVEAWQALPQSNYLTIQAASG